MHFGFILVLALYPVKDLHVKLRRTTMVIEEHKKALMKVMILCKLGLAVPEEHLTMAVIVYLHLVWSSSIRFFAEDGFTKLAPIHELSINFKRLCYPAAPHGSCPCVADGLACIRSASKRKKVNNTCKKKSDSACLLSLSCMLCTSMLPKIPLHLNFKTKLSLKPFALLIISFHRWFSHFEIFKTKYHIGMF
jgi:hypothetical protein